jgi:hypothetical protein
MAKSKFSGKKAKSKGKRSSKGKAGGRRGTAWRAYVGVSSAPIPW